MATRSEMSERTRGALISAARRLHSERPHTDVTLADIATAAGMTKGALYHHWSTKEELVAAVQEDSYDQVITRSIEIVEGNLAPAAELRALIALHVEMVLAHRAMLPITIGPSTTATYGDRLRAKRRQIEDFVVDVIRRGVASGEFAVGHDPRLSAYLILGACFWTTRWYRPDGSWSVEHIADDLIALTLDGIVRRA